MSDADAFLIIHFGWPTADQLPQPVSCLCRHTHHESCFKFCSAICAKPMGPGMAAEMRLKRQGRSPHPPGTMRLGSTTRVVAKCMLKNYGMSNCLAAGRKESSLLAVQVRLSLGAPRGNLDAMQLRQL